MIDILLTWLPNIATVLLIACYIPQIVSNAKTKQVEGISIWFFIVLIAALGTFFVYNILLFFKVGVLLGCITEGVNVLLAVVVLIQVLVYRKKPVVASVPDEVVKKLIENKELDSLNDELASSPTPEEVPVAEPQVETATVEPTTPPQQ